MPLALSKLAAAAQVELVEVVDFFSKPELFRASGAVIPRGVLLCGPPGTGKTLLGERLLACMSWSCVQPLHLVACKWPADRSSAP